MLLYFDQRNVALMRLLSKTLKSISGFGFRGLAHFKLQTHLMEVSFVTFRLHGSYCSPGLSYVTYSFLHSIVI